MREGYRERVEGQAQREPGAAKRRDGTRVTDETAQSEHLKRARSTSSPVGRPRPRECSRAQGWRPRTGTGPQEQQKSGINPSQREEKVDL